MPGTDIACAAPANSSAPGFSAVSTSTFATISLSTSDATIDQNVINLDLTPPSLSITSNSAIRIENYAGTSISLSGEANDDLKIANVTWYTTRGAEGTCTGIESWRADNIPLSPGENLITIAATDLAGNVGVDCITIVSIASVDTKIVVPTTNVEPNSIIDVSVVYTNNGINDVNNLLVSAQVPQEMDYVLGSAEASGGAWDSATRTVSWTIDCLPVSQSGTKVFKATIK